MELQVFFFFMDSQGQDGQLGIDGHLGRETAIFTSNTQRHMNAVQYIRISYNRADLAQAVSSIVQKWRQ